MMNSWTENLIIMMIAAATRPQSSRKRLRRAIYAVSSIIVVLTVGTVGFHLIENLSYVDSFYFESMMAAGQGPPFPLLTDTGKIFASIMGFVSISAVATTLVFTLGPVLAELWREGLERVEEDARIIEKDIIKKRTKNEEREPSDSA
jgi:hypothetical protein